MNKFYKFENEVLNFMFLLKFLEMCFIFLNKELFMILFVVYLWD